MLRDREWSPVYTSDDGSLATQFYIPALTEAVRYDRGTGYFSAGSLACNMRGMEGMIRNGGRMRLLVGCTLNGEEVEAIRRGEDMKKKVENNLCRIPLDPPDADTADALELLSWMVAAGHMDIRVAVRCDGNGRPVANSIYHKKVGVVQDRAGDILAWTGSDNETPSGQSANSETLTVFASWEAPRHQRRAVAEFEKDWSGRESRLAVMDVPEAARRKLLTYAPSKGRLPARLDPQRATAAKDAVWSFIGQACGAKNGGMVGPATAPVVPWPYQLQVFRRLRAGRPARLLIADEVGLGKTIQAGLFLRQAWLEGRRRILVMAPAGLTRQWQTELREKLNLDWPIYDGKTLSWQDTHACGSGRKRQDSLTGRGPVIVSSHLARRDERARGIAAAEWDVVVLDEAHYARQTNPNNPDKHTPNNMLRFMRRLRERTEDLILLTATPMQLHPVELYDLLDLLGLPPEWNRADFERFYMRVRGLEREDLHFMKAMFRSSEKRYGPIDRSRIDATRLETNKALNILRHDRNARPLAKDYRTMENALRLCSPVTRLISRNTRRQLRENIRANELGWKLGVRAVVDEPVSMSTGERRAYDAVDSYISNVWNTYKGSNRQAVGFALTIYRKRLASSFAALGATLENHLDRLDGEPRRVSLYADGYEDELDVEDIEAGEAEALKAMDRETVHELLAMIRTLPPDTKFDRLIGIIKELRRDGYGQVMVFTQFTDTMDFLREGLKGEWRVMCYSGRHGEMPGKDDSWEPLTREDTKARFLEGSVDILVCTDAAAEGLNFQFCGAMINYDMPWNPMRVEQRIGRIDRIGQKYETIRIVNMYYEDTIEADVYRVLRTRINLFVDVVGGLQPILADLDRRIAAGALERDNTTVRDTEKMVDEARDSPGLDLDAMLAADTAKYEPLESPVTMDDLDRIAGSAALMRPCRTKAVGRRQYNIATPSGTRFRITTDRDLFERHADSMEFWSPDSPAFPKPVSLPEIPRHDTLKELLDSMGYPR